MAVVVAATALALAGCTSQPAAQPRATTSRTPERAPAFELHAPPAEAVLSLVPQSATTITVTDWDQIRVQLGQPDLTGESPMGERNEFWRRAEQEAPLLADGMLRADSSTYLLDYGFTQDDVDWEAHWTGPDGPGYALAFRPDMPMDQVLLAIRQGAGAIGHGRLMEREHLVVDGTSDVDTWANEAGWADLVDQPAEATYLHRGCIPVEDALGAGADSEAMDEVEATGTVPYLDALPGFAVGFGDHNATVRMAPERADLFDRLHLADKWPNDDFGRAFHAGVADPSSGRLGYTVPDPPRAAGLALLDELPFGVCNSFDPLPEPPGQ